MNKNTTDRRGNEEESQEAGFPSARFEPNTTMFSPAGVVTYAYGPQAAGCVPYWMVAATAATSAAAAGGRSPLAGGQVPAGVQSESPARIPVASNSTYPPSAAAYHDLLKRTAQLNDLLYPSVIPLPGTLTADNTSPTAVRGSGPQGLRSNQDMPKIIQEPSDQRAGRDLKSPELSSLRRSCHPLSPSAVKSKDLKFGIDRILHPSQSSDSSKGKQHTMWAAFPKVDTLHTHRGFLFTPNTMFFSQRVSLL